MLKQHTLFLAIAIFISSCTSRPEDVKENDLLPDIYPDYVEVTVPVGIAPLNFSMSDDAYDKIDVEMSGEKGGSLHANGSHADFDVQKWHELLSMNRGSRINVKVTARKEGRWTGFRSFPIHVSEDNLKDGEYLSTH